MNPVLFKIGGLNFYTHGFFMVVAMIAGGLLIYYFAKQRGRRTDAIFDLVVFSLLGGVIAARITYFIVYNSQYSSWTDIFKIWQGGLVSWGGFLAGLLIYLLVLRLYREPAKPWLDLLGVAGLLSIAVGRIGSFLSGELAGTPTTLPWAVYGVHPVTLYEAALLLIAFFLFLSLYQRNKIKREGMYFTMVILLYSLVRFILDFLRTDKVFWLGLTMTQLISAVIIILIAGYLVAITSTRKGAGYAGS